MGVPDTKMSGFDVNRSPDKEKDQKLVDVADGARGAPNGRDIPCKPAFFYCVCVHSSPLVFYP